MSQVETSNKCQFETSILEPFSVETYLRFQLDTSNKIRGIWGLNLGPQIKNLGVFHKWGYRLSWGLNLGLIWGLNLRPILWNRAQNTYKINAMRWKKGSAYRLKLGNSPILGKWERRPKRLTCYSRDRFLPAVFTNVWFYINLIEVISILWCTTFLMTFIH